MGEGKGKDTFTTKVSFTPIQFPVDKNKILRCGGLCFIDGLKFLVDAGYFTHAHLDHVGRLPVLVKNGFKGTVITHRATWSLAGHILKDAFHLMDEKSPLYTERDFYLPLRMRGIYFEYKGRRLTFSGDLGNKDKSIIRDPQNPQKTEILVCESTYGDRNHKPIKESIEELKKELLYIPVEGCFG